MKRWHLIVALILLAAPACAEDFHALNFEEWHSADTPATPVTLDDFSDQLLIVQFYRADCMPCQIELQQLRKLASAHPYSTIALVTLTDDVKTRQRIAQAKLPANVHVLKPMADAAIVLTDFGDARHSLPFNVALRKDGGICKQHQGLLGSDTVNDWIAACNN